MPDTIDHTSKIFQFHAVPRVEMNDRPSFTVGLLHNSTGLAGCLGGNNSNNVNIMPHGVYPDITSWLLQACVLPTQGSLYTDNIYRLPCILSCGLIIAVKAINSLECRSRAETLHGFPMLAVNIMHYKYFSQRRRTCAYILIAHHNHCSLLWI